MIKKSQSRSQGHFYVSSSILSLAVNFIWGLVCDDTDHDVYDTDNFVYL